MAVMTDHSIIEIAETDFRPVESFQLGWRWTDAKYKVLPSDDLSRIRPLTAAKADELMRCVSPFYGSYASDLDPSLFTEVEMINTSTGASDVADWLRSRHGETSATVAVSWDAEAAVVADWQVFCDHWDAFCYPASDDVAVVPLDGRWALLYFHEEYFTFGKRMP